MILSQLNYLAVGVSALVYFMIGAIWYNKKVFGTVWAKGHNINFDNADTSGLGKMMAMTFVSCVGIAIVCGYLTTAMYSYTCMTGMKLGAIMGVGFSGLTYYINCLYTKRSFSIVMIDSGYHIVGITLTCIIMSVWR